jgi:hypothetical protein
LSLRILSEWRVRVSAALEPTRACYHVNRGNIFGSCLILVGVLTIFLLALGVTRMKLTPPIGTLHCPTPPPTTLRSLSRACQLRSCVVELRSCSCWLLVQLLLVCC